MKILNKIFPAVLNAKLLEKHLKLAKDHSDLTLPVRSFYSQPVILKIAFRYFYFYNVRVASKGKVYQILSRYFSLWTPKITGALRLSKELWLPHSPPW